MDLLTEAFSDAGPIVGGGGVRVTPPESSAWMVGRAEATCWVESDDDEEDEELSELAGRPRRSTGGPESSS